MKPIHTQYSNAQTFVFPEAITLKVLLSGDHTDGNLAVFEDIVAPGVGPGRHIHHHQDETFMFLEGEFIAEVDGKLYHFQPGDVAFVPKGTIHAFKNVGNTTGKLRYIFSPAQTIEAMFIEMYQALEQEGELSIETMAMISQKHGQEFVGPPL